MRVLDEWRLRVSFSHSSTLPVTLLFVIWALGKWLTPMRVTVSCSHVVAIFNLPCQLPTKSTMGSWQRMLLEKVSPICASCPSLGAAPCHHPFVRPLPPGSSHPTPCHTSPTQHLASCLRATWGLQLPSSFPRVWWLEAYKKL